MQLVLCDRSHWVSYFFCLHPFFWSPFMLLCIHWINCFYLLHNTSWCTPTTFYLSPFPVIDTQVFYDIPGQFPQRSMWQSPAEFAHYFIWLLEFWVFSSVLVLVLVCVLWPFFKIMIAIFLSLFYGNFLYMLDMIHLLALEIVTVLSHSATN